MIVAVTGGTGFLGRAVVELLVSRGRSVRMLVRQAASARAGTDIVVGDLNDTRALTTLCRGADVLVHMAAAGVQARARTWAAMTDVNVRGTANVMAAALECGVASSVITGTVLEYRGGATMHEAPQDELPLREDDPTDPRDPYGATKSAASIVGRAIARDAKHPVVYLRMASMLGRGDDPDKLLPFVKRALLARQPVDLTSGAQIREWLHVDDGAAAVLRALELKSEAVINVGTGVGYPLREVVERFATHLGAPPELVRFGVRPHRGSELRQLVMNCARAKSLLDWQSTRSLDESLRDIAVAE